MRVLFWNTHNNTNINPVLVELILENSANIVALVEYKADINELLQMLAKQHINMQYYNTIGCNNIRIIGDIRNVKPNIQDERYSIQIVENDFIICCVHLPSQLYSSSDGRRRVKIHTIIKDIEKAESLNATEKTILLGDFNVNPFDHCCIDADLFHSLPYYEIVSRISRTVEKENYKMFYNPMWKFFGDDNKPAGTHFYNGSDLSNIFWHIFDQVMIRPSLKDFFVENALKIITFTSNWCLLDEKGHPDTKHISDHLPIIFEIKE